MRKLFIALVLCGWASTAQASWLISIVIDSDKTTAPAVGTATATFTDADGSVFTYSQRASMTAANATAFTNAAIAARNAWQARKTTETNSQNSLITNFTTAGETSVTGAPAQ
jgi:uncharacterized membrane protein